MGLDEKITQINAALEAGAWDEVVAQTAALYQEALAQGETGLAELVQDVHWIAQDAVAHPVEVARVLAP